jgi:oligopeptide transport system substrate-binding protein
MTRRGGLAAFGLALLAAGFANGPAAADTVIHRVLSADVTSLDPHLVGVTYETEVVADLFEGLTAYGPDAAIGPGAATSWEVSPDEKTYIFHLRPGLKWSDGTPLTAADFVYSLRRALAPDTGASYSAILNPIRGAQAIAEGKVKDLSTLGVEAVDPVTLRISVERPTPYLPAVLAHSMAFPVPKQAIERWGKDWTRPGPMAGHLRRSGRLQGVPRQRGGDRPGSRARVAGCTQEPADRAARAADPLYALYRDQPDPAAAGG